MRLINVLGHAAHPISFLQASHGAEAWSGLTTGVLAYLSEWAGPFTQTCGSIVSFSGSTDDHICTLASSMSTPPTLRSRVVIRSRRIARYLADPNLRLRWGRGPRPCCCRSCIARRLGSVIASMLHGSTSPELGIWDKALPTWPPARTLRRNYCVYTLS